MCARPTGRDRDLQAHRCHSAAFPVAFCSTDSKVGDWSGAECARGGGIGATGGSAEAERDQLNDRFRRRFQTIDATHSQLPLQQECCV